MTVRLFLRAMYMISVIECIEVSEKSSDNDQNASYAGSAGDSCDDYTARTACTESEACCGYLVLPSKAIRVCSGADGSDPPKDNGPIEFQCKEPGDSERASDKIRSYLLGTVSIIALGIHYI